MLFGGSYSEKHFATINGNMIVASPWTFTDFAFCDIFPHDTASSGVAPESEASNSCAVFMYTA